MEEKTKRDEKIQFLGEGQDLDSVKQNDYDIRLSSPGSSPQSGLECVPSCAFDSCAEMENSENKSSRTGPKVILPDLSQQLPEKREGSDQIQRKRNKIPSERMNGIKKDEDEQMPASITSRRQHATTINTSELAHQLDNHKALDVINDGMVDLDEDKETAANEECRDLGKQVREYTHTDFPLELRQALGGNLDMSEMANLETKMVAAFQKPDRQRPWRDGTLKSSFNYILLDPRITENLPNRACNLSDQDLFRTFISAMFYIGKGTGSRPHSHLHEAIKLQKEKAVVKDKIQKILDIWKDDLGVVVLYCFQSVIPVEAYTREACMVDAVGLKHLTNRKKGTYYDVSKTFLKTDRCKMGVYLLKKALQIFLADGERQLAPLDIENDVVIKF